VGGGGGGGGGVQLRIGGSKGRAARTSLHSAVFSSIKCPGLQGKN